MEDSQKEKIIDIHLEAQKSLVDYYRIILSEDNYVPPAPFHYELSDILLNREGNFALEMFRESAKSAYALKTFPLYKLSYPKRESRYIVIIKANQELASAKLQEIVSEYVNSPVLNFNLKEVKKNSAKIFEATVMGPDEMDVRIEAYGKGTSIRGLSWGNLRPQVIICDDLQDLEDSQSDTVQEKDWTWFLSDVKFLAKTGRIIVIGNNLGEKCIIERLMNDNFLNFEKIRKPAIEDGKATWPDMFSFEFLESERMEFNNLGKTDIWYRERMCQAISEESKLFKREYFKYWKDEDLFLREERDLNRLGFEFYISVDLAISEKQTADDTVLCVVGKKREAPEWYIFEMLGGKMDPLKTIDNLFYLYGKYRPLKVGIESVAYQKALFYFIEEEMKKRSQYFMIDELRNTNKKEERIKGLQPMYKTGVIYHREGMLKLEDQLLSFPYGLHDDYPDALAMMIQLIEGTSQRIFTQKTTSSYIDPIKKIHQRMSYRDPLNRN